MTSSFLSDLYVWGSVGHGESGLPYLEHSLCSKILTPKLASSLQGLAITKISLGDARTVALTSDGDVYHFGRVFGSSTDDNEVYHPRMFLWSDINWTPQKMSFPVSVRVSVREICCNHGSCFMVSEMEDIFAIGGNKYGQLGIGSFKSVASPTLVCLPSGEYLSLSRFSLSLSFPSASLCSAYLLSQLLSLPHILTLPSLSLYPSLPLLLLPHNSRQQL